MSNHQAFDQISLSILQVWINQGDIILVGLRDYQDAKADVILKYNADEARNLKTYGEIPDSVRLSMTEVTSFIFKVYLTLAYTIVTIKFSLF